MREQYTGQPFYRSRNSESLLAQDSPSITPSGDIVIFSVQGVFGSPGMSIISLQQSFAHYEQIKRFTLLPEPFSMERGELTNTLKLKRAVVAQNYKEVIDRMYEE